MQRIDWLAGWYPLEDVKTKWLGVVIDLSQGIYHGNTIFKYNWLRSIFFSTWKNNHNPNIQPVPENPTLSKKSDIWTKFHLFSPAKHTLWSEF